MTAPHSGLCILASIHKNGAPDPKVARPWPYGIDLHELPTPLLTAMLGHVRACVCIAALVDLAIFRPSTPPAWLVLQVVRSWAGAMRAELSVMAMIYDDASIPEDPGSRIPQSSSRLPRTRGGSSSSPAREQRHLERQRRRVATMRSSIRTVPIFVSLIVASCGGKTVPQCPSGIQAGASCPDTYRVANGSALDPLGPPTTVSGPTECYSCEGSGTGTYWTCSGSAGWEAAGTFSCAR